MAIDLVDPSSNHDQDDENELSGEDVPETHGKLLNAVSQLYRKQRITVPKRSEATKQISEFNLSNNAFDEGPLVKVQDLFQSLNKKASHAEIKKLLTSSRRQAKGLPKPIEKLVADKLKRESGYKSVTKQLSRWESIVQKNRAAEQLIFPLEKDDPISETPLIRPDSFLTDFKEPTELEKQLAEVLYGSDVVRQEVEEKEAFAKMSVKELLERRQMVAKMRARESYRIAKAVRQNKIKSKKYHRILKRERIKKELKEFELLQKTNPEAALEKLEYLERARAEERISLRHKNTGKWARGLAIRAKYDREARVQLSEQLSKSRELTKKLRTVDSDSEEDVDGPPKEVDDRQLNHANVSDKNPWIKKGGTEVDSFVKSYQQFWEKEQAKNKDTDSQPKLTSSEEEIQKAEVSREENNSFEKPKPPKLTVEHSGEKDSTVNAHEKQKTSKPARKQARPKKMNSQVVSKCGSWAVQDSKPNGCRPNSVEGIENKLEVIFDKAKEALDDRMKAVTSTHSHDSELVKKNKRGKKRAAKRTPPSPDLSFKTHDPKVAKLDSALIEETRKGISSGENYIAPIDLATPSDKPIPEKLPEIDPKKHLPVKMKKIATEIPDVEGAGESEDELEGEDSDSERMNLMEAFADDNIADEFSKEKEELLNESKAKEIDLSLPGWGQWAGKGLEKPTRRRNRRLILKVPEVTRKDAGKSKIIIRDEPTAKLKEHCVNDLPHPFTSVRDFENSIRAPVGSNWVTQQAHDKLVAPPVITKKGKIITPMDESQLLKVEKKQTVPKRNPMKNKTVKRR